jgi:hypothetical protein
MGLVPSGGIVEQGCLLPKGFVIFKHATHMWMCGAMVIAALLIVLITGKAVALLPAVGCVVMMVVMMQMMGGGNDGNTR